MKSSNAAMQQLAGLFKRLIQVGAGARGRARVRARGRARGRARV